MDMDIIENDRADRKQISLASRENGFGGERYAALSARILSAARRSIDESAARPASPISPDDIGPVNADIAAYHLGFGA